MAEESDFLKKVYDRYLGTDYQWGDSDLNPKREIARTSEEEWEDEQQAMLDLIAARVKELRELSSNFKKYKKTEKIDNDNFITTSSGVGGNANPSSSVNEAETKLKIATGGGLGNSHLIFPDTESNTDADFLTSEIERLTLSLTAAFDIDSPPAGGVNDTSNLLYNVGCDDINVYSESDLSMTDSDFKSMSDSLSSEAESNSDENESSSEDEQSSTNSSKTTAEASDDAAAATEEARAAAVDEQEAQIKACIVAELGILNAILSLLKVVNALKKALLLVMSIVTPIIKMVAFAAQCWINPPAAGQVIQMVAEKIAALLVTVIGIILQKLWNLLEMDCQTEVVQSVLDQINDILSGVDSTLTMTDSLINFGKSQTKATMSSLKDSYQKLAQTQQWENAFKDLKDAAKWESLENSMTGAMNDKLFGSEGWSASGVQNALGNVLPSSIKDQINALIESSKEAVSQSQAALSKIDGEGSSSLAQKLTDMQEFLGPIRIR